MELLDKRPLDIAKVTDEWELAELPFTGRKLELEALREVLEKAPTLGGKLVLISGEAGIGKTRLAHETIPLAESIGYLCLRAKCSKGMASYSPWIELIRKFSAEASAQCFFRACGANIDKIVRLVPQLSESIRSDQTETVTPTPVISNIGSSSSSLSAEDVLREESLFLDGLARFFFRAADETPLLIILDDLHLCDGASLNLLRRFAFSPEVRLGSLPIVFLGLYRDLEPELARNQALVSLISDLSGCANRSYERIQLARLDRNDISNVVDETLPMVKSDTSTDGLKDLVYLRTGGNPLFLLEVLRSLVEQKHIFMTPEGRWALGKADSKLLLPSTIRTLIKQRLSYVDVATADLLRIASAIGEKFGYSVLQNVVDLSLGATKKESPILLLLEKALKAGLISKSTPTDYLFSDESVMEVLYDGLEPNRKRSLHDAIARSLESRYISEGGNSVDENSTELAHHFLKAGNVVKAWEYYVRAAKRNSGLYAHREAYDCYAVALELLETSGDRELKNRLLSAEILNGMADESQFLPGYGRAFECWERAAELYESCGEKLKAASTWIKLSAAYHLILYEVEKSEIARQRAYVLASKDKTTAPSAERAHIILWSALADMWRGDREKVMEKFTIAVRMAEQTNAYDTLAMSYSYVIAINPVREIDMAIKSCDTGLQISHEHGLVWEASYNYFHRASVHNYTRGPSAKSLEIYLEGLNFTESRGNFTVSLFHKVEMVYGIYLPLGEWKKAREVAEEAMSSVRLFPPNSLFQLIATSAMGQVLLHEGDLEGAENCFEQVRRVTNGFGILQIDVALYIALTSLNIKKGDLQKAEAYLNEGYRLSKQRGLTVINGIPHVQILSLMIEFCIFKRESGGKEREADLEVEQYLDRVFGELSESSREINQEWTPAYAHRAEGLIFAWRRNHADAASSLQKSAAMFEKLRWPYELARTLVQLGSVEIRRGNVLSAMKVLDSALDEFSHLGARLDADQVTAMKRKIEKLPLFDENPRFVNEESDVVFQALVSEFIDDLLMKKIEPDKCGWRTLSELHKKLNLSRYVFYGRGVAKSGPVLNELLSSGLVERRTFEGQRGRGGEVTKIRVNLPKGNYRNRLERP